MGILLGVVFYAGFSGTFAVSASAINGEVIEDLGRAAEELHPPPLDLPHVEIPSSTQKDFGASDQAVITDLNGDKASGAATVGKAAADVGEDTGEQDKVKKCVAAGFRAIISEVLEAAEPPSVVEAVEDALTPCFDAFVPEGERVRELADYIAKATAEKVDEAYEDANEDPVVLGDWILSTAATVEQTAPEPTPEPTPTPTPPEPDGSGRGISPGVIVVIIVIVLGLIAVILSRRK